MFISMPETDVIIRWIWDDIARKSGSYDIHWGMSRVFYLPQHRTMRQGTHFTSHAIDRMLGFWWWKSIVKILGLPIRGSNSEPSMQQAGILPLDHPAVTWCCKFWNFNSSFNKRCSGANAFTTDCVTMLSPGPHSIASLIFWQNTFEVNLIKYFMEVKYTSQPGKFVELFILLFCLRLKSLYVLNFFGLASLLLVSFICFKATVVLHYKIWHWVLSHHIVLA